jgi:hypothetical protein
MPKTLEDAAKVVVGHVLAAERNSANERRERGIASTVLTPRSNVTEGKGPSGY